MTTNSGDERVLGRISLALLFAGTLGLTGPALAEPPAIAIEIDAGPLSAGLRALERQTGIELLYDRDLVSEVSVRRVAGNLAADEALRRLLVDTNLTTRRAQSGAWIIERPDTPPLAQQDAQVTQILVVGLKTQNSDVHRTEKDVQPYTVASKAEIVSAHRDNIDQFLNSRVTSNTQIGDPFFLTDGDTTSEINLRGLGSDNTMVLVDGRRMPSIYNQAAGFAQADINSIPFHAIKQIEVLTGAAGGIHGFGALGGAINVILDRDSRGFDLHLTQGITSRGDARRQSFEAGFGYTSEDGATDLSLFGSTSEFDTLFVGQRDFMYRDRVASFANAPEIFLLNNPTGNSVTVRDALGSNLIFKPEYGGAELASTYTFLPAGFSGTNADLISSLTDHAGQRDFSLSEGVAKTDLGSRPHSSALLLNLRHSINDGAEAYADVLALRSQGESHERTLGSTEGFALIAPESPVNPFNNFIVLAFPIDGFDQAVNKHFETVRYTGGILADLPFGWRGAAEASLGSARFTAEVSSQYDLTGVILALFGDPSDMETNPFGDWDAFQRSIAVDPQRFSIRNAYRTEFSDQSLRLAGPLWETGAGPTTLTLLAERRREHLPPYFLSVTNESGGLTTRSESQQSSLTATTRSAYAELRLPLFSSDDKPAWLLRGLEVQLAFRSDDQDIEVGGERSASEPRFVNFEGSAFTAGAKMSPTPWLMLRGSYATGKQPLNLALVNDAPDEMSTSAQASDPKRGNTALGAEGAYLWRRSNSSRLDLIEADTTYFGAILTPYGVDGPSLAIDYSQIRKTNEIMLVFAGMVMAHEDVWPERVVRAPLTDDDRAKGYTAGRVILLDTHAMNGQGRKVDAYDLRAEWPVTFVGGRLRFYADATYHKRNTLTRMFEPDQQDAGYLQRPLKWRANGGLDWSINDLTIGANVQYFDSYYIYDPGLPYVEHVQLQGSDRVSSQTYLDLYASWRLPVEAIGPLREAVLEFGAINVFDEAPAREAGEPLTGGPGFSLYGDPRQRRFEVTLSSYF